VEGAFHAGAVVGAKGTTLAEGIVELLPVRQVGLKIFFGGREGRGGLGKPRHGIVAERHLAGGEANAGATPKVKHHLDEIAKVQLGACLFA
jgi:hypothetical protein